MDDWLSIPEDRIAPRAGQLCLVLGLTALLLMMLLAQSSPAVGL